MTSAKTELVDMLQRSREAHQSFVADLSEAERTATGTFKYEEWTAKDVVAHCTLWMQQSHNRMEKIKHGELPERGVEGDDERLNAQNYEAQRDRSWADILADADQVMQALVDDLAPFSDEDLKKPGYFPQPDRTIFGLYVGNALSHPAQHYTDYYVLRGELARAEQVQERVTHVYRNLSDNYSKGIADYNLACFYARTNRPEQALALLPAALRLAPDLTGWSKEDPDLVSLHDKPEYMALYTA